MRATRIVWGTAATIATIGVVGFLVAHRATRPSDLPRLVRATLREAAQNPWIVLPTAIAVGCAAASVVLARRPRQRRRLTYGMPLSPMAIVDSKVALVVRETLLALARSLQGFLTLPEPDMVGFLDELLQAAVQVGASDVHMHPLETGTRISFRVHGVLEDVTVLPSEHHPRLIMRLKVVARLVAFRSDRPQDGHFAIDTAHGSADIRISLVPTNHGETVALRIARSGVELPDLATLGLPAPLRERYMDVLRKPQGLIFLTGPTGSGKTTTIYASLGHIKKLRGETTKIATIEDPVEFDVPFLTQTQVNPTVGLTFAQGLRSMLRQDPNVIMVGEIRDAETAHIAVQAGLTGHLILTTIHAESATGVFNRLVEMGVEPFLLASATLACLSQRLMRTLCPYCRVPQTALARHELARLTVAGIAPALFYTAKGCARCGGSGHLGRMGIYELLVVTPRIRELVQAKVSTPQIHEAACAQGMTPLLGAGVEQAKNGAASLAEIFRVAG